MEDNRYYYQIMVISGPHKHEKEDLYYWVRDNKIPYKNTNELISFIRSNFRVLKKYKHKIKIYANEVTMNTVVEMNEWYERNSKIRDYNIIFD